MTQDDTPLPAIKDHKLPLPSYLSHLPTLDLDHLARDTVLFIRPGVFTHEEVYGEQGYNVTAEELARLQTYPPYQAAIARWEKASEANGKALAKEQAKVLFTANMRNLHIRLQGEKTTAGQVISAMDMLADIADLKPRKDDNNSGLTVVLDFGASMNQVIQPKRIIEHDDTYFAEERDD